MKNRNQILAEIVAAGGEITVLKNGDRISVAIIPTVHEITLALL